MVSPVQFSQSLQKMCRTPTSNGAARNASWTKPKIDLPTYPWDHSASYWHESRLSLDYRKRSARHPLLGAPSPDFNLLEPSWRNVVRVSEIPWIRGHIIQSNIVYPTAGYIAMAIEAAKQRSRLVGRANAISKYRLNDINIGKKAICADDSEAVETIFSFRPYNRSARKSSAVRDEFRIFSYTKSEGWSEHCRGLITVEHKERISEVEGDSERHRKLSTYQKAIETARAHCQGVMDPIQLYEILHSIGLEFQDCFKCIEELVVSPDQSLGAIHIPNTAAVMPKRIEHPHIIHPATLDACMQMTSQSLIRAGALQAPMVPTFIEEICVSSDISTEPGEKLLVHTSTTRAGKCSSKSSLTATSQSSSPTQLPQIQISGFVFTAIPGSAGSNQEAHVESRRCHRVRWAPDVAFLRNQDLLQLGGPELALTDTTDHIELYKNATVYFVRKALSLLQSDDCIIESQNNLLEWMKQAAVDENHPRISEDEAQGLISRTKACGIEGDKLCQIGENLVLILKGEIEHFSLMQGSETVTNVNLNEDPSHPNALIAQFMNMLAHKSGKLSILEICTSTNSTSRAILEALACNEDGQSNSTRLSHYDITSSPENWEEMEALSKLWTEDVAFRKLDISQDLQAQGYESGRYDVVIASGISHTVPHFDRTMRNCCRILKPGGKLILWVADLTCLFHHILYGVRPDWWQGKYDVIALF